MEARAQAEQMSDPLLRRRMLSMAESYREWHYVPSSAWLGTGRTKSSLTKPLHQAVVIAYRAVGGQVQVLLITSRDTGRWIIPKGNISTGVSPSRAAETEAYEEGGVKGETEGSNPLGFYTYFKERGSGDRCPTSVEVYLLHVAKRVKKWPEKRERRLSWVSLEEAIRLVEEPGVVPLLRRLAELVEFNALPSG